MDWGGSKNNPLSVRCVRKEGTKLTSIVPDGLVGHWKFDEVSGTTATDSSAEENDATLTNVTFDANSVPAMLGTGIDIGAGGQSAAANAGMPASYLNMKAFTVSAWVNLQSNDSISGIVGIPGLFEFETGFTDSRLWFAALAWDTTAGNWNNGIPLPFGSWTHVSVSYDYDAPLGTKPIFYVNGVAYEAGTAFAPDGTFVAPSPANTVIGRGLGSSTHQFRGEMDDVRIYDRVLSPEEIHYLYQSFDRNVKYDADRRVPKYFNGEEWVAMGESKYVPNAVEFDGTNDYMLRGGALTGVTDGKRITELCPKVGDGLK